MKALKIDPEFESLIPPLSPDEYQQLEANILEDGCRDALVTWNGVIVDGHNRHKICRQHKLPFRTEEKYFDCREDAIIWICQNQRGRRNITTQQRDYLMGKEYQANVKKQGSNNQYVQKSENLQNEGEHSESSRTAKEIASKHGVHFSTVERSDRFAKGVDKLAVHSPTAKQSILSGAVKIPKTEIREIRNMPDEEVAEIAKQIETGTYERSAPSNQSIGYRKAGESLANRMAQTDALGDADTDGETLVANMDAYTKSIKSLIPNSETMQAISGPIKEKIMASACKLEETMTFLKKLIKGDNQ